MKKILFNLLGLAAIATAISSCKPMDKTYKALDGLPGAAKSLTYTIQAADYTNTNVYPSTSAVYKSKGFTSTADANANIPALLNYKFFDYPDGSNANITFTPISPSIAAPDSVFKDVSYTLTYDDYLLLPNNKYADFSIAQVLSWLSYKYPAPMPNQLQVLTWTFYPTIPASAPAVYPGIYVTTTDKVTTATGSFSFINGAWIQAYQITPAQYASVGRGQYNQFTSADDPSLISYLNNLLKTDPYVAGNAKAGSVEYVSFNYYSSTKVTSQRVIQLLFDGTNWGPSKGTLTFVKSNGKWIPDPTVYYTLTTADTKLIGNPNGTNNTDIGTSAQRANLYQYGDFSGWAVADLNKAMILVLTTDFPHPTINISYKVTFLVYSGGDKPTTYTYVYNGTSWTAKQ